MTLENAQIKAFKRNGSVYITEEKGPERIKRVFCNLDLETLPKRNRTTGRIVEAFRKAQEIIVPNGNGSYDESCINFAKRNLGIKVEP